MGFVAALVDECRYVRQPIGVNKVYGQPVAADPTKGPWIKCRLDDTGGASGPTVDDDARRRFRKAPSIMINKKAKDGTATSLRAGETIEVRARGGLTSGIWMIDGGLRVVRTRASLHHYEASLVRITDDATDVGDEAAVP